MNVNDKISNVYFNLIGIFDTHSIENISLESFNGKYIVLKTAGESRRSGFPHLRPRTSWKFGIYIIEEEGNNGNTVYVYYPAACILQVSKISESVSVYILLFQIIEIPLLDTYKKSI